MAAQKKKTEELVKIDKSQLPAGFGEVSDAAPERANMPYIGFYSGKGKDAPYVEELSDSLAKGAPYICFGEGDVELLSDRPIMCPQVFPYSRGKLTAEYRLTEIGDYDEYPDGWKQEALAVALVIDVANKDIISTVSTFRGAKSGVPLQVQAAARRTEKDGWAEKNALNAQLAQLPPAMRTAGRIKVSTRTSNSTGYEYVEARAAARALTMEQAEVLANWITRGSPGLTEAIDLFETRKAQCEELRVN